MKDIAAPVQYRVGSLTYTLRTLMILFFWLLWGDLCFTLMESVVPSILPIRFQKIGATNTEIGMIMITLPQLINAVANPIISFRSDRFRSKWGRRIPFIVWTLPWLVISVIGLGFADKIVDWAMPLLPHSLGITHQYASIWIIGIFMVAFCFFNAFVNSVFWYLFNDVVPPTLIARFMSLFRLVSTFSGAAYNIYVFKYAGQHDVAILCGVSLLYFFGFGFMCFMVKEGRYPPPPEMLGKALGPIKYVITFAKESLTLRHYWLVFLTSCFQYCSLATATFTFFFYRSTGMSIPEIGRVNGYALIVLGATIPISGWLADRYHPLRVVIVGFLLNICIAIPATMVWLFWRPAAHLVFTIWIILNVVLAAPITALIGIFDPVALYRLFPRSRLGQYASANAMLRSIVAIGAGIGIGKFFDIAGHYMPKAHVYFLSPIWTITFTIPAMICCILLFNSWKKYGGDDSYVPPVPGESLTEVLHDENVSGEEADTREPVAVH